MCPTWQVEALGKTPHLSSLGSSFSLKKDHCGAKLKHTVWAQNSQGQNPTPKITKYDPG